MYVHCSCVTKIPPDEAPNVGPRLDTDIENDGRSFHIHLKSELLRFLRQPP